MAVFWHNITYKIGGRPGLAYEPQFADLWFRPRIYLVSEQALYDDQKKEINREFLLWLSGNESD